MEAESRSKGHVGTVANTQESRGFSIDDAGKAKLAKKQSILRTSRWRVQSVALAKSGPYQRGIDSPDCQNIRKRTGKK